MPGGSRVIRDEEDNPVVNFVLHKGAGISGIVHAGCPTLAGADVVLVSPSQPAFLTNGMPPTGQRSPGRQDRRRRPVRLPAAGAAVHDRRAPRSGIRRANDPTWLPTRPADLTVRPWGRIEGTLRIGRRPGAGQTLTSLRATGRHARRPCPAGTAVTSDDEAGSARAGHARRGHHLARDLVDQAIALE